MRDFLILVDTDKAQFKIQDEHKSFVAAFRVYEAEHDKRTCSQTEALVLAGIDIAIMFNARKDKPRMDGLGTEEEMKSAFEVVNGGTVLAVRSYAGEDWSIVGFTAGYRASAIALIRNDILNTDDGLILELNEPYQDHKFLGAIEEEIIEDMISLI